MARGRWIAERDWPDFRKLMAEFRAVGKTLRRPPKSDGSRGGRGSRTWIGKLDQTLAPGLHTGANRVVSIYKGPGHSPDVDKGIDFDVDYVFAETDVTTTQYVSVWKHEGKVNVSPLNCPVAP